MSWFTAPMKTARFKLFGCSSGASVGAARLRDEPLVVPAGACTTQLPDAGASFIEAKRQMMALCTLPAKSICTVPEPGTARPGASKAVTRREPMITLCLAVHARLSPAFEVTVGCGATAPWWLTHRMTGRFAGGVMAPVANAAASAVDVPAPLAARFSGDGRSRLSPF